MLYTYRVRLRIIYDGHNACLMYDHDTVISFTLITIVIHQNLLKATSVTLASFIQPRAVDCSYSCFEPPFRMRIILLLRNTEYVERWYYYLFIAYIFFTLLNMHIYYIVVLSLAPLVEKHWPKARSSSIAIAIDRLGIPDLSDNV